MCWTATTGKEYEEYIANNNIPVMKLVNIAPFNTIYSYFRDFEYELNHIYRVDNFGLDIEVIANVIYIKRGFHSYSTKIKIEKATKVRNGFEGIIVRHESIIVDTLPANCYVHTLKTNLAIADCIIPKGAHYFLNNNGEYVSDKIKIINVYKIKAK